MVKENDDLALVVLDFDLQDKKGTNAKIVRRIAIQSSGVRLLVLVSRPIQRRIVQDILGAEKFNGRIQIASGMSRYTSGISFIRATRRASASRS